MDADVASEFATMGFQVDPETVETEDGGVIEVWRENWDSLRAFRALETQWRAVAGLAGLVWLGIDFNAADVVLRRFNSPDHVFEDLIAMEDAALAVFAEVEREQ